MVRIILGMASFMLMWTLCGSVKAQAIRTIAAPTGATGRGETVDTAKRDAHKKAAELINAAMTRGNFTSFVVNEEYVREHVLADAGKVGDDIRIDGFEKPFKSWVVPFRADYTDDLIRRDRAAARNLRAEERQTLTSRIMLGLSLLLIAGVGYVRLDEYTNRRYTRGLRVAAVGLAGAVAAGWWLVFVQAPG